MRHTQKSADSCGVRTIKETGTLDADNNKEGVVMVEFSSQNAAASVVTPIDFDNGSMVFFEANASAKGRYIFNDATTDLFVKFGANGSMTDFTVKLAAGDYLEFSQPLYTGVVSAEWETPGSGKGYATEVS